MLFVYSMCVQFKTVYTFKLLSKFQQQASKFVLVSETLSKF